MVFSLDIPYADPLAAFAPFARLSFAQLLHSCPGSDGGGRYSTIMLDPFDHLVWCQGDDGNPFDLLRGAMKSYALDAPGQDMPPFWGGAAGFLSYELGRVLEKITPEIIDDFAMPHMCFGFYDVVIVFDHKEKCAQIISTGLPERDAEKRQIRAKDRAEECAARLERSAAVLPVAPQELSRPVSNVDKKTYLSQVARAIEYVYAGDIYQANFTQRFETILPEGGSLYDLFPTACALSPVSYAAYINCPGGTIASLSPERFLSLIQRGGGWHLQARPIKGTAPRSEDKAKDDALKAALQISEKDRAENIMIVDLMRNDLSKVCQDNTVEVDDLCAVESYVGVHHLVSTVCGDVRHECGAVDALQACFPGGSITGAPKIRAMEVIAELEGRARGVYCGAIGYLGFDGSMDTNIAIRTMICPDQGAQGDQAVYYQAGGGIVADSDPEMEYEECLSKARAFFALGNSSGGGASGGGSLGNETSDYPP